MRPAGEETNHVRGQRHVVVSDTLQRQNRAAVKETRLIKQQGLRGKSAGAKDGGARRGWVATFALLAHLALHARRRHFPLDQDGWSLFFALVSSRETEFTKFCRRRR